METYSLMKILLYGFWAPLLAIGFMFFYFKILFDRYRGRKDYHDEIFLRENIEKTSYTLERELDRLRSALSNSMEGLSEELPNKILNKLSNQFENELNKYSSKLQNQINISSIDRKEIISNISSNEILIREMSHFLNTPLSQIEAALLAIKTTTGLNNENNNDLIKDIDAVKSSVNICKSFLAAYRELILVAKSSKTWAPESIKDSLTSASNLFIRKSKKDLKIDLNLPDTINGYSNNYIVSLLLPLIENATESSPDNSEILIKGHKENNFYNISVSNVNGNINDIKDDIYQDGFTTKPNHEGMGLSIVKHLLSSNNRASISHKVKGSVISFLIKLPAGE